MTANPLVGDDEKYKKTATVCFPNPSHGHVYPVSERVFFVALCNLWSGVMEWSLGMEPWSGVLEWILEWSEVRFGVIVALLGQDLVLIDQFLLNAYFYGALCT